MNPSMTRHVIKTSLCVVIAFSTRLSIAEDAPPATPTTSPPVSKQAATGTKAPGANPATPRVAPLDDLGPIPSLGIEQVSPLLSLNPEQRQKIQDIIQSSRNDVQAMFAGAQQMSREQREIKLPAIREKAQLVIQGYRRKLESVLTAAQAQRLRELSLQVRGYAAVNDPDIAEALALSSEQRVKVAATLDEVAAMRRNLALAPRAANRFERKDRRQAKRQLKTVVTERIGSILTQEQLDQFAQMQGPKLGLNDLLQLQSNAAATPSANGFNDLVPDLGDPKPDLGEPVPDLGKPQKP